MTTRPYSLSRVLTRRLAVIALAAAAINLVAVAVRYVGMPAELARSALQREARALHAALDPDHPELQVPATWRADFRAHPQDYAYAIVDAQGTIIDSENRHWLPDLPSFATTLRTLDLEQAQDRRTLRLSVLAATHRGAQVHVVVAMAGDPAHWKLRALIDELVSHVALPMIPVVLLLLGSNAALLRRALQPVAAAAAWARALQPGASNPPAPPRDSIPEELQQLVDALERALDRLQSALAAERRRSAEAAHALRTPLAVLLARLDGLPAGAPTQTLRRDLLSLTRTVQQLLSAASADMALPGRGTVDLADVARSAITQLAPFAHAHGAELELVADPDGATARADAAAVELALSNLIENAVLHGGGDVRVQAGPGPTLAVRDRGPGLPSGAESSLFEPFQRGPDAAPGGTGLGLAIVERVMRSQEGRVEAATHPQGGAIFILHFRTPER